MALRFYLIYSVCVCAFDSRIAEAPSEITENDIAFTLTLNAVCVWLRTFTWSIGILFSHCSFDCLVRCGCQLWLWRWWWWPNLSLWMSAWVSINVRYFAYSWESQHTNWFRRFFALSLAKHLRQHSLGSVLTFPVPIWSFKMHVIAETFHLIYANLFTK